MSISKTYIYRKPQRMRQWFKTKTVNSWKRTINGKNKRQLAWSERNKSMSINGDKSESWTKAATQSLSSDTSTLFAFVPSVLFQNIPLAPRQARNWLLQLLMPSNTVLSFKFCLTRVTDILQEHLLWQQFRIKCETNI